MTGAKSSETRLQTKGSDHSTASRMTWQHHLYKNAIKKESRTQRERNNLVWWRRRVNKFLQSVTSPARKERFYKELIELEKKLQKLYKQSSEYKEKKATTLESKPQSTSTITQNRFSKTKPKGWTTGRSEYKPMAEILAEQYNKTFTQ